MANQPRVYYNEFDAKAATWLRELIKAGLIPDGDVDERSILDVKPTDLQKYTQCHFFAGIGGWSYALRLAGIGPSTRLWTGSCPCQPFSAAGKQLGTSDERHLWPAFFKLIEQCCPPIVFGEQVASKLGRDWLSGVRADLEGVGYAVGAADLCAAGACPEVAGWIWIADKCDEAGGQWIPASAGPPHIRQRLYWVAHAPCSGWGQAGCDTSGDNEAYRGWPGDWAGDAGKDGGLADADSGECSGQPNGKGCECDGQAAGWQQGDSKSESGGSIGGLGHSEGGFGGLPIQSGRQDEEASEFVGASKVDGLEHAEGDGRESRGTESIGRSVASRCSASGMGDTQGEGRSGMEPQHQSGFGERTRAWSSGAIIIPCADGKSRRIKSSIQPLAYGVSGRVAVARPTQCSAASPEEVRWVNRIAALKGSGNAIVPQIAAEFVAASFAAFAPNVK